MTGARHHGRRIAATVVVDADSDGCWSGIDAEPNRRGVAVASGVRQALLRDAVELDRDRFGDAREVTDEFEEDLRSGANIGVDPRSVPLGGEFAQAASRPSSSTACDRRRTNASRKVADMRATMPEMMPASSVIAVSFEPMPIDAA